jgi:histidinol phosphatase-like enzyme (inositol monophosphatase family)
MPCAPQRRRPINGRPRGPANGNNATMPTKRDHNESAGKPVGLSAHTVIAVPLHVVAGYSDDLRLAHVLADGADDLTMKRFRALDLHVETKPDLTPVSDADRAVEDQIRGTLKRARPRDAVIGEEYGQSGYGARCWVIDPIDGTKNFVRGVPVWATLIALTEKDEVVVGLVSAPSLNRRWWAARGGGAWTGRSLAKASRLQVSAVTELSDASLSFSSLSGWEEQGRLDDFMDLTRSVWRTRAYGDFWSHMMVAEGAVDISTEPEVSLWDLAALQVILEEAGGVLTDLGGVARPDGGSVVCTNGHLHDEVLRTLSGDWPDPV